MDFDELQEAIFDTLSITKSLSIKADIGMHSLLVYINIYTQDSANPSIDKDTEDKPKKTRAKKEAPDESKFDSFWEVYPRKVNKVHAKKAWFKNSCDLNVKKIIADVSARSESDPQWDKVQFIPHPSTYLNEQRWEDEWAANETSDDVVHYI